MRFFILTICLSIFCFFVSAQDTVSIGLPKEVDSVLKVNRLDSLHRTIYWYKHDPNYHPVLNLKDTSIFKNSAFDALFQKKYPSDKVYQIKLKEIKNISQERNIDATEIGILRALKVNWEIYFLVLLLIFFAIIRNKFFGNLYEIIDANWNNRYLNHFLRDENFFRLRSSVFFIVFFILSFSFFVYLVNERFEIIDLNGNYPFIKIIGFIGGFYFIRFHLVRLLNFMFDLGKLFNGYNTLFYISNIFFTLAILPLLIFIPFVSSGYSDLLLIIGLLLWCLITAYKYIRTAIYLLFHFQFPIFYLFVYLCTLEIAPLLVLVKLITEHNDKIG